MPLKSLKSKMKYRISRSRDTVFVPRDFFDLSDRDQIGRVLRGFIQGGSLIKIGYGLYAKASRSPYTGNLIPDKGLQRLAEEALKKLGVPTSESIAEKRYNRGETTQVPTGRRIAVKKRITRKIGYDGKYISYESATRL
jgi:hypothetical protein